MNRILITIMVIVTLAVGAFVFAGANHHTAAVIKTKAQPFKTHFLASCESAGGHANATTCGCAYGQLVSLYGDNWDSAANKAIVNRIETDGLNQIETNAVSNCMAG